jgi:DNA-binding NarL/FixJ family response regulator
VDDEEGVRFALRHILNSTDEFRCVGEFGSATEALTGLFATQAQVVLMDASLPDLSGIECTRRLKEVLPDLKVIMISAHADSETIRQSFAAGATQFLVKPFSAAQCRVMIRMAFFSSPRAASS